MSGKDTGVTNSVDNWSYAENHVERNQDNFAFTSAHPNNTLVLAGPARFPSGVTNPAEELLPLGSTQSFSWAQQRPVQPLMALGSARTFFSVGKSQVSFNLGRFVVNGRNLLRALYSEAVRSGISIKDFHERPVRSEGTEQFFANLDSELFYIPFGICVLFRSVSNDPVGAVYIELCMLNSIQMGYSAGQSMIMESASGIADRIRPVYPASLTGAKGSPSSTSLITDVMKQPAQPVPDLATR